jgi:hypothetical protein
MADQDMNRDQQMKLVMERIRKILAMTESPHEEEAKTASEIAHKMLKEYNLSLSDLEVEREGIVEEQYDAEFSRLPAWKSALLMQIMKTNYCSSYFNWIGYSHSAFRKEKKIRYIMVGREANVATAKAMADYLLNVVERLSKDYPVEEGQRLSYKVGMSFGLRTRLAAMIAQEKAESPASTALVKRENALVENYMAQKDLTKGKPLNLNIKNGDAYRAGQRDAANVSLNNQVTNGRKPCVAGYLG